MAKANEAAGATRLSDFYVLEKIGDGAYSEVFKVRRHTDQKIYALKKVSRGGAYLWLDRSKWASFRPRRRTMH